MSDQAWPYNLPLWRSNDEATSPDGKLGARIDPAYEVSVEFKTPSDLNQSFKVIPGPWPETVREGTN